MSNEIIIALLSLVGTVIGSGLGVIASSRLTNYRIQQLEKKVEKHNSVVAYGCRGKGNPGRQSQDRRFGKEDGA